MNFKYFSLAIVSFPLLPIMYFQGKRIRAKVPKLPEAKGTEGQVVLSNKKTLRLLAIGESTIAGVGVATHEEGFTGTLATALSQKFGCGIQWKVYARSGYTAKQVTNKLLSKITESEADIIVIGLGGNDAFTLNRPWAWAAAIDELILEVKSKFGDTPIIFTNMPPIKLFPAFTPLIKFVMGNLVEILGQKLSRVIKKHNHVFYESRIISFDNWAEEVDVTASESDYFSDGVHPSLITYQIWGKTMAKFIATNPTIKKRIDSKVG